MRPLNPHLRALLSRVITPLKAHTETLIECLGGEPPESVDRLRESRDRAVDECAVLRPLFDGLVADRARFIAQRDAAQLEIVELRAEVELMRGGAVLEAEPGPVAWLIDRPSGKRDVRFAYPQFTAPGSVVVPLYAVAPSAEPAGPCMYVVEQSRGAEEWVTWTVARDQDDAEKTTVTLRRCNAERRARVATYSRTATGPEV